MLWGISRGNPKRQWESSCCLLDNAVVNETVYSYFCVDFYKKECQGDCILVTKRL